MSEPWPEDKDKPAICPGCQRPDDKCECAAVAVAELRDEAVDEADDGWGR